MINSVKCGLILICIALVILIPKSNGEENSHISDTSKNKGGIASSDAGKEHEAKLDENDQRPSSKLKNENSVLEKGDQEKDSNCDKDKFVKVEDVKVADDNKPNQKEESNQKGEQSEQSNQPLGSCEGKSYDTNIAESNQAPIVSDSKKQTSKDEDNNRESKNQKLRLSVKGKDNIQDDQDDEDEENEIEEEEKQEDDYDDDEDMDSDCQPTTPECPPTTPECPPTTTACDTPTTCKCTTESKCTTEAKCTTTPPCKTTQEKCTTKCPKICAKANRKVIGYRTTESPMAWDMDKRKITKNRRKTHNKVNGGH